MEQLLIGGVQGLLNYAGLSFIDKLKINKYLKKVEKRTATITEYAKVISYLRSDKEAISKITQICEVLLNNNKHSFFANTNLGVLQVHIFIYSYEDKHVEKTEYVQAMNYFQTALLLKEDKTITESIQGEGDTLTLLSTIAIMHYYYGYLLHLKGCSEDAEAHKANGLKYMPKLKNHLPY